MPTAVAVPDGGAERAASVRPPPRRVDRYELGAILGMGGLGVVYEGWDPTLQRRVAVKLVRTPGRGRMRGSERFLREAQALAQLSHPNVVGVYGVGRCKDESTVYVVMEHIDGRTLSTWAEESARSVDEIVEVFVAAGRGITAAHAAGIIHRDFKPDNVMIDREGRVLVLDFGLALVGEPGTMSAADSIDALPTEAGRGGRLTEVGLVMGTPTYMAPEQHTGKPVSTASDQYAFCVAMLSVLRKGAAIYSGATPQEMAVAKARGRLEPRPKGDDTPRWLEAVLLRGLRADPAERWPSMDALLEALTRPRRRALPYVVGAGVVALSVGAALAFEPPAMNCVDGADRLQSVWDHHREQASAAIRDALGSRASQSLERLDARFEQDVAVWRESYVTTCEAHASKALDDQAFDRRLSCLWRSAREHEGLLEALSTDHRAAEGVAESLVRLGTVEACVDDDELVVADLRTPLPAAPRLRSEVERLRQEIRDADAEIRDGAFGEARRRLENAAAEAERMEFGPLLAEVRYAQGRLETGRSDNAAAAETFEHALSLAEASGHDYVAAGIAADLVFLYARVRRLDEAERLLSLGTALAKRVGDPQALRYKLASAAMSLYSRQQRYEEALAAIEKAMPSEPPESPPDRFQYSFSLNNLAIVNLRIGNDRRAQELLSEALVLREEALGTDHPKLGTLHLNLAKAMARNGDYADAETHATRALELSLGYGETHEGVSSALISRGVVRKKMGRYDEARADYDRALSLLREADRPVAEAMVLANLGNVEKKLGDLDAAMRLHAQALAMREAELGPKSVDVAASLGDIGGLHRLMKRHDQAWEHFDRELSIEMEALGSDHPTLVRTRLHRANLAVDEEDYARARQELEDALRIVRTRRMDDTSAASCFTALGRIEYAQGHHEAAVEAFREAVERHTKATGNPGEVGQARLGLARAAWDLGRTAEARDALSAARVELRNAGPGAADDREALEVLAKAWSGPEAVGGAG